MKDKPNGMQSCREPPGEKKAFLSVQSRETEEDKRVIKTRELFKKLERSRGNFMQGWLQ